MTWGRSGDLPPQEPGLRGRRRRRSCSLKEGDRLPFDVSQTELAGADDGLARSPQARSRLLGWRRVRSIRAHSSRVQASKVGPGCGCWWWRSRRGAPRRRRTDPWWQAGQGSGGPSRRRCRPRSPEVGHDRDLSALPAVRPPRVAGPSAQGSTIRQRSATPGWACVGGPSVAASPARHRSTPAWELGPGGVVGYRVPHPIPAPYQTATDQRFQDTRPA